MSNKKISNSKKTLNNTKKKQIKNQNINRASVRRKNANKIKRKNNNFFEKLTIVFILSIVVYLCFLVYMETRKEQLTEVFVTSGSIEDVIEGNAKIIRNEKVIYADRDGDVEYYYHEGDKIKNGTLICQVYEKQLVNDIDTKLDELDLMISKNQEESLSNSVKQELASVDEYIYSLIDEYLVYSKTDYAFDVYELREELESKFAMKKNIYIKNGNSQVSKYISERDNYNNVLAGNKKAIYSPMGGIISYYIDGFEENYTPENITNLNGKYLQIETSKMVTGNKKSEVRASEPICKIVDNSMWYITAVFDKEKTNGWTNNLKKSLRVKNVSDEPIRGTIVNILEYGKTNIVTFQINEQINKYMAFRDIEVEVIANSISGLKISNSAIDSKEVVGIPKNYVSSKQNKYYVVKEEQNQKKTISIEVVSSDEQFYYVLLSDKILDIGDRLINPDTSEITVLSAKKEIYGVYQIVGKDYVFKPVNILISNDSSTIIDGSENQNIKIYDKVVLDSEMVK